MFERPFSNRKPSRLLKERERERICEVITSRVRSDAGVLGTACWSFSENLQANGCTAAGHSLAVELHGRRPPRRRITIGGHACYKIGSELKLLAVELKMSYRY